ncbi:5675_t:CDS:2 [Scutellospora calospora]|uniref:5675_t:CDS:1 n=1 Tax=Scutellospora calospora TaxID=85575 RepID=A0ACA9K2C9_9GLOM|nr:5675_t:CDS:2 [Scutellospora calospora]
MPKQKLCTKKWITNYKQSNNTIYENQNNEILQENSYRQIITLSEYKTRNTIQHHDQEYNISKNIFWCELTEFCCNRGKRLILLLPDYPMNMNIIFSNPKISSFSRKLNALFSFMAIGVQDQFVNLPALSLYIYDEQERYIASRNHKILKEWILIINTTLTKINPYIHLLRVFKNNSYDGILELRENTSTGEVAVIIYADSIANYEPLQYPLLFSHSTSGWHPKNFYNLSQIDWYRCRLLYLLRTYFGTVIYMIDVIEFQKCRFPYAHIVIRIQLELPVEQIDKIVNAELLHEQSHLKNVVEKYMVHKQQHSSCPDHINYTINNTSENSSRQPINKFKDYINGRYLSAPEAA